MAFSTTEPHTVGHSSLTVLPRRPTLQLVQENSLHSMEGTQAYLPTAPTNRTDLPPCSDQCENSAPRIAHDLLNILPAIQGHAELAALHSAQPDLFQHNLRSVLSASQRAHELLQHMLRQMPHQDTSLQELDLCIVIEEALDVLKATLPSSIVLETIDHLHVGRMMGDTTQLFRMLSNLLSNAVQAMRKLQQGHLWIILDRVLGPPDPTRIPTRPISNYLRLIVQDTGKGMPADLCRRIFDPYFSTQDDGKGMGLGLAIVKEVVTAHNGIVTVESDPLSGSKFTVYFLEHQGA